MSTQTVVIKERSSTRDLTQPALILLVWPAIALLVCLVLWMLRPPAAVPASASLQEFSAARALSDVHVIARVPHPIGSPANATVRDYLVRRLTELQMSPQVSSGIGITVHLDSVSAGKVENVIGRISGTHNSEAVLLVAHYDSVYRAPGAGDDAAAVAALLETLRALRAGPALKNDVIVLFTDGEEEGLLGAESFAHSHPFMKQAGLIMNFEGRGNQGISLLFETSAANRTLLRETASVSPQPFASSLFYSIYKLLPNDTDFTVLRRSQKPGLNFAFGGGFEAYHSALDTPEHLSAASVQNHGAYALALTRHFGDMDLTQLGSGKGDAVFFNSVGHHLIEYSESWVFPNTILLVLLVLASLTINIRRKEITAGRTILASLAWCVILLAVPVVLMGVWWVVSLDIGDRLIRGDAPANALFLTGLVLAGLVLTMYAVRIGRSRLGVRPFCFGGLVTTTLLSLVLAAKLPAGSYLLVVPLLFAVAGLLLAGIIAKGNRLVESAFTAPSVLVMILLYAPLMYLVYIFLTLQILTAAVAGLLVVLCFAIGAPLLALAVPASKPLRWTSGILASLVLVCLVSGILLSHPSAVHPKFDTVLYSVNSNERTAAWLSYDQTLDSFTSHFLTGTQLRRQAMPDFLAGSVRPMWSTPATLADLAPPEMDIKSNEQAGRERHLHLVVRSRRGARLMHLRFDKSVRVSAVNIGGRDVAVQQDATEPFTLNLSGLNQGEMDINLTVSGTHDLVFWAMDESDGLPVPAQRPPDHLAWYGSDVTLVCRKYSVPAPASL